MSIKSLNSSGVIDSVQQSLQRPAKGNWLVCLVKRHFELRRQKQRRADGFEAIRKLPRYLQADVGFEIKTNIDD